MKLKLVENCFDSASADGYNGLIIPCILCRYCYQITKGSRAYYCEVDGTGSRMRHPSIFRPVIPEKDEYGCPEFKYKIWTLRKLI